MEAADKQDKYPCIGRSRCTSIERYHIINMDQFGNVGRGTPPWIISPIPKGKYSMSRDTTGSPTPFPIDESATPAELDRFVDHFLSIMCDHSRRQILELLAKPESESVIDEHISPLERRSGDIARSLGLSPATVSGHLRQLARIGLVTSRREGNAIYYRLSNHMLVRAFHDLVVALNQEHEQRLSNNAT